MKDLWLFRAWLVEQADRAANSNLEYDRGWRAAMILVVGKLDEAVKKEDK